MDKTNFKEESFFSKGPDQERGESVPKYGPIMILSMYEKKLVKEGQTEITIKPGERVLKIGQIIELQGENQVLKATIKNIENKTNGRLGLSLILFKKSAENK